MSGDGPPRAWSTPRQLTYLQAILAEFLFPVNSASLEALNSISLFTSSSVTANRGVKGQTPLPLRPSSWPPSPTFVVVFWELRQRVEVGFHGLHRWR